MGTSHLTASSFQECCGTLCFLAVVSLVQSRPSPFPANCARHSVPGQAGLGGATCLEELSEDQHPPGAPAGRVAQGPLPAAGCLPRALPVPGGSRRVVMWLRRDRRARAGDTRPRGGTAGKAPVCPVPTDSSGNQVLRGLVEEPLMESVPPLPTAPPSQSGGDRGMGHPPKHSFLSIPMPSACHHPGPALPWHLGWQGFAWHGSGGAREPPQQDAAPPLPESPAGCGCKRQVRAGERCLEFVSRSRERQEQILIINNPAGWRLCRQREGGQAAPHGKAGMGEERAAQLHRCHPAEG